MIKVRAMQAADLDVADRVHRLAFGTRFRLPDPTSFRGDGEIIRPRFAIDAGAALVAEDDGRIVGGAVAMDWGSVFIVGPVFVDPAHGNRGTARAVVARMLEIADARAPKLVALFTFPESATHLRLYEGFGFVPHLLTPVMAKEVGARGGGGALYSGLSPQAQEKALAGCRAVTDAIFPGLDLTREIRAAATHRFGDTVLLDADGARGFAICHTGPGGEGGSGHLFIKFAAVRPNAPDDFKELLARCEAYAAAAGAKRISGGSNIGRREAYRLMQEQGYRAGLIGVAMHRPGGAGYNRPDVFAIDDWR
jgi:predicted N-acetyltransferase YhbS